MKHQRTFESQKVQTWSAGLAALAIGLGSGSEAYASTRKWLDISVGAQAATNPYLSSSDSSGGEAITFSVDGGLVFQGETTTIGLNGYARLEQYLGDRYGTDRGAGGGANISTRLSERTAISGSFYARTSPSGAQDFVRVTNSEFEYITQVPSDTPEPSVPEAPVPDITTAGRGVRVNSYSANVSLSHTLSPTKTIGFGLNAGHTDTDDLAGRNHWQYGLNLNYRQQLNERMALIAAVRASRADYSDVGAGPGEDSTFVSSLAGLSFDLTASTKVTAQAGVTWTRLSAGQEHVNFAGDVSVCRRSTRSSICGSASHSSQATTFGGISTVTSVAVRYNLQTGLRDQLSIGARYGHTSRIGALSADTSSQIYGASATYSREIGQRFSGTITPSITKYSSSSGGRSDFNAQVEVGISYRFGDV